MKSFIQHLSTYAQYHRDSRNIATHLVGVPIIVFSVILLLSKPQFNIANMTISLATIGYVLAILYYCKLHIGFGLIMAFLMGLAVYAAANISQAPTFVWLTLSLGLFVGGWIIQFVGHYYEGKKPAFADDIMGLLIGPLFVTAELLFMFGLCKSLEEEIIKRAGEIRTVTPVGNTK